jgi:hypothetical protein
LAKQGKYQSGLIPDSLDGDCVEWVIVILSHPLSPEDRQRVAARQPFRLGHRLLLPQQQINDPTTSHMDTPRAAVGEDVGVVATGVLKGVSEDQQPVERQLGVDARGEGQDGGRELGRVEVDWAEGVAEDVSNECRLDISLSPDSSRVCRVALLVERHARRSTMTNSSYVQWPLNEVAHALG